MNTTNVELKYSNQQQQLQLQQHRVGNVKSDQNKETFKINQKQDAIQSIYNNPENNSYGAYLAGIYV